MAMIDPGFTLIVSTQEGGDEVSLTNNNPTASARYRITILGPRTEHTLQPGTSNNHDLQTGQEVRVENIGTVPIELDLFGEPLAGSATV